MPVYANIPVRAGKEVHVGAPSVVGCGVESWTAKAAFSFLACPALRLMASEAGRQVRARQGKASQFVVVAGQAS